MKPMDADAELELVFEDPPFEVEIGGFGEH